MTAVGIGISDVVNGILDSSPYLAKEIQSADGIRLMYD